MKKGNDYKKRNKNIKKENYLNYKNLKIVIILLLTFPKHSPIYKVNYKTFLFISFFFIYFRY